jgi:hypothetical protein
VAAPEDDVLADDARDELDDLGSRASARKSDTPRTPSPLSPSMWADTSFSGRTPGLRRSSSSSASRMAVVRSAGRRQRGITQPSASY